MAWRQLVVGAGFVGGAVVGGAIGWALGYYGWGLRGGGLVFGISFLMSFLLMLFGLVAPLMLVRYVTDRGSAFGGEPGDEFMADSWVANYVLDMALSR